MRIIQGLPTFASGSGVGNSVLSFDKILKEEGIDTAIYANVIRGFDEGAGRHSSEIYKEDADCIIYHLSNGNAFNEQVTALPFKKIMVYHNITPPEFFEKYDAYAASVSAGGLRQLLKLKDRFDLIIADSSFNKEELIKRGYNGDLIKVLPIIVPYDQETEPDRELLDQLNDGKENILFVGRVAPNKKTEDIIRSFYFYNTYYNPSSRLILAGDYGGRNAEYYKDLKKYTSVLRIDDKVIFTGFVTERELKACYTAADLFLCLSEHEGFCLPIVEAMQNKVPIIAFDAGAVGETMGSGGILLKKKDPAVVATLMNKVLRDRNVKETVIRNQQKELERLSEGAIKQRFLEIIREVTDQR